MEPPRRPLKTLEYHQLRASYADSWDLAELETGASAGDDLFSARIRRLLPTPEERFPEDPGQPELSPIDTKLLGLCEQYRAASPEQRTFICALVTRGLGGALQGWGVRLATLAVAERSIERVRVALVAHAIDDLASGDVRDTMCLLAPLVDAARRLGSDPVELFLEAAGLAQPAMARVLQDYVQRPDGPPSLSSMGMRAVETPDGLRYRQVGFA